MDLLLSLGWSPKTVLDVGGFKGNWTRDHQRMFPTATFTVIEPNPHAELQSVKGRVLYEIVSSQCATIPWYSNLSTGDSIYRETTRHYSNVTPTHRTTTTLDALFPTETFDFVKLDVQGAEVDVLRGGMRLFQGTEVLLLECPFAGRYNEGAPTFTTYIETVTSLGFSPLDIVEFHRAGSVLIQVDIVFLRTSSPLWSRIQTRLTA
jgi:FkbM family methyltransferase